MSKLKISIVIATRDRNELLEKTLISLSNQTIEKFFEIIVCNDGGKPYTEKIVRKYNQKLI